MDSTTPRRIHASGSYVAIQQQQQQQLYTPRYRGSVNSIPLPLPGVSPLLSPRYTQSFTSGSVGADSPLSAIASTPHISTTSLAHTSFPGNPPHATPEAAISLTSSAASNVSAHSAAHWTTGYLQTAPLQSGTISHSPSYRLQTPRGVDANTSASNAPITDPTRTIQPGFVYGSSSYHMQHSYHSSYTMPIPQSSAAQATISLMEHQTTPNRYPQHSLAQSYLYTPTISSSASFRSPLPNDSHPSHPIQSPRNLEHELLPDIPLVEKREATEKPPLPPSAQTRVSPIEKYASQVSSQASAPHVVSPNWTNGLGQSEQNVSPPINPIMEAASPVPENRTQSRHSPEQKGAHPETELSPRSNALMGMYIKGSNRAGEPLHIIGLPENAITKWYVSLDDGSYSVIPGANSRTYVPSEYDIGRLLVAEIHHGETVETVHSKPILSSYISAQFSVPGVSEPCRLTNLEVVGGTKGKRPLSLHPTFSHPISPWSIPCTIQWYRSSPRQANSGPEAHHYPIPGACSFTFIPTIDDVGCSIKVTYRLSSTGETFTVFVSPSRVLLDPAIEDIVSRNVSTSRATFQVWYQDQFPSPKSATFSFSSEGIKLYDSYTIYLRTKYSPTLEFMCHQGETEKLYINVDDTDVYTIICQSQFDRDVILLTARRLIDSRTPKTGLHRTRSSKSGSSVLTSGRETFRRILNHIIE